MASKRKHRKNSTCSTCYPTGLIHGLQRQLISISCCFRKNNRGTGYENHRHDGKGLHTNLGRPQSFYTTTHEICLYENVSALLHDDRFTACLLDLFRAYDVSCSPFSIKTIAVTHLSISDRNANTYIVAFLFVSNCLIRVCPRVYVSICILRWIAAT